jgi:peptidoglycan/LPS O-acetylase OafA/YrhL
MISVIIGFYIALPLIARPYASHPLIGLALAAAMTVAWKLGADALSVGERGWLTELIAVDQLPGWAFSFALGMTGAWAWVRWRAREREVAPGMALGALALGLCAFAACAYAYGRTAADINVAFAGSVARENELLGLAYSAARALVLGAILVGPLWLQRPFNAKPARKLAELTYGLYLIHLPVAIVVGAVLPQLPTDGSPVAVAAWLGIVLSLSLMYAKFTRRFFERPIVRRVRRRPPKPSAALQSRARAPEEPGHPGREAHLPARAARAGRSLGL